MVAEKEANAARLVFSLHDSSGVWGASKNEMRGHRGGNGLRGVVEVVLAELRVKTLWHVESTSLNETARRHDEVGLLETVLPRSRVVCEQLRRLAGSSSGSTPPVTLAKQQQGLCYRSPGSATGTARLIFCPRDAALGGPVAAPSTKLPGTRGPQSNRGPVRGGAHIPPGGQAVDDLENRQGSLPGDGLWESGVIGELKRAIFILDDFLKTTSPDISNGSPWGIRCWGWA